MEFKHNNSPQSDAQANAITLHQPVGLRQILARLPFPVWLEQTLKFLTVGLLNTTLDAGLYFLLTRWVGFAEFQVLAKSLSYGMGILNSFYWNRSWTFKSETSASKTLTPFVLVKLVGLALNAGVMYLCLNAYNLPEILSLALATGFSLMWNFTVSKFVVFKK